MLLPFLFSFGIIALVGILSRPPVKLFSIRVGMPVAMSLMLVALLWSAANVVIEGKWTLLLSKVAAVSGMALAYKFRSVCIIPQKKQATSKTLRFHNDSCTHCQHHLRSIWGPRPTYPKSLYKLDRIKNLSLLECQYCGVLWVHHPYSPDNKFPYLVHWKFGAQTWRSMRKVDNGIPILNWMSIEIKRGFSKLPDDELQMVELHRKCTQFQNNPIDSFVPPPTFAQV